MVTILVIGREMGNQLAQCMVTARVRVLEVEDVGKVRLYKRARALVLDGSMVPLEPETFQSVREQVKVPLLAIVSTHEEAWLALQLGCDEALVRPFDPEELKLRAHRMLRLVGNDRSLVGELLIDLRARQVRRGEEKLHLTPLEFDLLAHLARHPRRAVSYDELWRKVWGYDGLLDKGVIQRAMSRLREKLGGEWIVCVRRRGYRLG